jgi:hypothetical protein
MSVYDGIPLPLLKLPPFFGSQMGVPFGDAPSGIRAASRSMVYYVDRTHPDANDTHDGTDPDHPLLTIQQAIDNHNALIDWADAFGGLLPFSWILVGPGLYAENLTPAYFCHIIGLGQLGTDTATEVHPAAGSALAGTGLGLHLRNIRFEVETAVPVLDFGICNNTVIEDCEIVKGIAGLATVGIDFTNASHVQILRNRFLSGVANIATGIYFDGGANQYAHAVLIQGNHIFAATTGIHVEADCTATLLTIKDNLIAGRPVTGINDLSGLSWCAGNYITASTDAIVHANSATQCIANHVIDAAVGAVEAAGTS